MYKDVFEILLFCKETFLCKEGHLLGQKRLEKMLNVSAFLKGKQIK